MVVLIWVQVVANAFGGWFLLYLAQEDESHNREVHSLVYFLSYASFVAAGLLAVCAVLLIGRRLAWPRYATIVIEWLSIASWGMAFSIAESDSGAGLPPIIPVLVVIQLLKKELANWYDNSPRRR